VDDSNETGDVLLLVLSFPRGVLRRFGHMLKRDVAADFIAHATACFSSVRLDCIRSEGAELHSDDLVVAFWCRPTPDMPLDLIQRQLSELWQTTVAKRLNDESPRPRTPWWRFWR
jgi:hypothetical protein